MRTSSEPLQGVQFWLDAERGDATVIDKILPTGVFMGSNMPFVRDAALSPLSWAAIDKSQLCFDDDGPVEATNLKRFLGIFGQVLLESALGADPAQVEAHLYRDYINDAAHRMYSHSSDFLIQSFSGPQDAHDHDARSLVDQFDFMAEARRRGLGEVQMQHYVTDGYPDLNIDRAEFGLRQMAGMGWLGRTGPGTKLNIAQYLGINENGSLDVKDIDFGTKFFVGFCLLGSETWLNPLQKVALQNQQHYLKHKMSSPIHMTVVDEFRRLGGSRGRAHPYDGLYGFEWETDDRYKVVDGDQISRDFEFVARALSSLSRTRNRVYEVQRFATAVAEDPQKAQKFIHPTEPIGEREAMPIGLSVLHSNNSGTDVEYDEAREALVFSLPGAMKSRVLDPQLAEGGRLCDSGWRADFKADFENFTRENFVVVLHGVRKEFGRRYIDNIRRVDEAYAEALKTPRMPASELARVIEYVGRASIRSAINLDFQKNTAYPFVVLADDELRRENDRQLQKTRQLLYGPSALEV